MLDFPHTARELECCDFGPRVGLAYRLGNSLGDPLRLWHGLVRADRHHDAVHAAAVSVRSDGGQQSQDNINPAFLLSSGPTVQVTAPNPNSGLGQGVFGVERNVGLGQFAAVELHGAEDLRATT